MVGLVWRPKKESGEEGSESASLYLRASVDNRSSTDLSSRAHSGRVHSPQVYLDRNPFFLKCHWVGSFSRQQRRLGQRKCLMSIQESEDPRFPGQTPSQCLKPAYQAFPTHSACPRHRRLAAMYGPLWWLGWSHCLNVGCEGDP